MTEFEPARAASPRWMLGIRGAIGGTLMGLANLVPGISGGTMLLAAGVYPGFINAIAEVTTLRFHTRSLILIGAIGGSAGLAILLLAGSVKGLVVEHRWMMYSSFIGLTLGGVPLVWRMARPMSAAVALGGCGGLVVMIAMTLTRGIGSAGDESNHLLLFLSGLAASSAMILPGVSGGYLLLILGQYESILGTIDQLKIGLLGDGTSGGDVGLVLEALKVVIPLGFGVLAGVVGVSNLLRWLLRRFEKATLGVLLGLLAGAVIGLWPFQEAREPVVGEQIRGRTVTEANAASFKPEYWPLEAFEPRAGQIATALALIAVGFGATDVIGRLGRER